MCADLCELRRQATTREELGEVKEKLALHRDIVMADRHITERQILTAEDAMFITTVCQAVTVKYLLPLLGDFLIFP